MATPPVLIYGRCCRGRESPSSEQPKHFSEHKLEDTVRTDSAMNSRRRGRCTTWVRTLILEEACHAELQGCESACGERRPVGCSVQNEAVRVFCFTGELCGQSQNTKYGISCVFQLSYFFYRWRIFFGTSRFNDSSDIEMKLLSKNM